MLNEAFVIGLLLSMFIFILPAFSHELRQSHSVLFVYWFVVLLHQFVAFTNAFWFTTFGAELDASSFQRLGVEHALSGEFMFGIGGEFYENFLGIVYRMFGASHMLGEQLSVLAFSLSCILLLKISRLLEMTRYQATCLLAFGALPTMVLLGSVTLRESYQVMFFMLAVYVGIKMHLKGGVNVYLLVLILSSFLMGLFHNGLLVYSFFLIMLFMVWALHPLSNLGGIKKLRLMALLIMPVLLIAIVALAQTKLGGTGALSAMADLSPLEAAASYRDHSPQTRASYGVSLDLSSPLMGLYSTSLLYVNYLFAPFPWQVRSIPDAYAFLESILRFILIFCAVIAWKRANGTHRRLRGLMLMLFFSTSLLWAMGTSNYGTAMRHHMLDWWILVIIGLPLLLDTARNTYFDFIYRVHCKPSVKTGDLS